MAILRYNGIGITGISASVPLNKVDNKYFETFFNTSVIDKVSKATGVFERRFVSETICASDLCFSAACELIEKLNLNKDEIDFLIFASQTPDYKKPATAPILQKRLGLNKTTAAFDINLACSSYIYGLSTAFAFAAQEGVRRVLLLVGETMSKTVSLKDRATSLLFGDAGTATLIEKGDFGTSSFSLNTDGSGEDFLKIKAGGYRYPSTQDSLLEKIYEDGSIRSDEQMYMNSLEVSNFIIREVSSDINKLLKFSNLNKDDVAYFVFHQANRLILDYLIKKLALPGNKVPMSLSIYGNTSSASIPLTIVDVLQEKYIQKTRLFCSAFGAGFSWGTCTVELSKNCCIPGLQEV